MNKILLTTIITTFTAVTAFASSPLTAPFQSYGLGENHYMGNHAEQVVIGANSVVDNQGAIAIGTHTMTRGVDAVTIGNNASAPVQNSVAIGTNSQTYEPVAFGQMQINGNTHIFAGDKPNSTVSFGSKKSETYSHIDNYNRQLQNVSAGRIQADSLDAVNGSQLYAAIDEINTLGNVTKQIKGDVANNGKQIKNNTTAIAVNHKDIQSIQATVKDNTSAITDLQSNWKNVDNKIKTVDDRVTRVGSASAALAGLHPLEFNKNDKASYAVSAGNYRDKNTVALGAFYRPNQNTLIGFGTTLGAERMTNVSASFKFGRHSEYEPTGKNKDGDIETMKDEIKQLKLMVHNLMFGGK